MVDELIELGIGVPPRADKTFRLAWCKRINERAKVNKRPPFLWKSRGYAWKKVFTNKAVAADVLVTLFDPELSKEFRSRIKGTAIIADPFKAAEADTKHAGLEHAVSLALRERLEVISRKTPLLDPKQGFVGLFFPADNNVAMGIRQASEQAFADCGLSISRLAFEKAPWIDQEIFSFTSGPRNVLTSDPGDSTRPTMLRIDLEPDPDHVAAHLTAREPLQLDEGDGKSLRKDATKVMFDLIEGRYSTHDYTFSAKVIEAEIKRVVDKEIAPKYGRRVKILRLSGDDDDIRNLSTHPEPYDFAQDYDIPNPRRAVSLEHRCEIKIVNLGKLAGKAAERFMIAKGQIVQVTRRCILEKTENRLNADLHVFANETTNPLSLELKADEALNRQLATLGMALQEFFVFRSMQTKVPDADIFDLETSIEIRGASRALKLNNSIRWEVGEVRLGDNIERTADSERRYVAKGCKSVTEFRELLGKRSDYVSRSQIQNKSFGDIIFDFYQDQEQSQHRLSSLIQQDLNEHFKEYGVAIVSVITVLEQIPEASFLTGRTIDGSTEMYRLSQNEETIELGFRLKDLKLQHEGRDRLRLHLNGGKPGAVDEAISNLVKDVIRAEVGSMKLITFLNSIWGDGYDKAQQEDLVEEIKKVLEERFGLVLSFDDVTIQMGESKLVGQRRSLKGIGGQLDVSAPIVRADRRHDRLEGTLRFTWHVRDLADGDDAVALFVDHARNLDTTNKWQVKVEHTLDATLKKLLAMCTWEALEQAVFQQGRCAALIAQIAEEEVASAMGLRIRIPPRQLLAITAEQERPSDYEFLKERRNSLLVKKYELLGRVDFDQNDQKELDRIAAALERIDEQLRPETVDFDSMIYRDALASTHGRLSDYVRKHAYTEVDPTLLLPDLREQRADQGT